MKIFHSSIQLDKALKAYYSKNFDKAIKILNKLLENPDENEVYVRNNLASSYAYKGDFSSAIEVLEDFVKDTEKCSSFTLALYSVLINDINYDESYKYNDLALDKIDNDISNLIIRNKQNVIGSYMRYVLLSSLLTEKYKEGIKIYKKYKTYLFGTNSPYIAALCAINRGSLGLVSSLIIDYDSPLSDNIINAVKIIREYDLPKPILKYSVEDIFDQDVAIGSIGFGYEENVMLRPEMMLAMIDRLDEIDTDYEINGIMNALVTQTGDWGIDFAQRVFDIGNLDIKLKYAALDGLIELGLKKKGEFVKVRVGKKTLDIISSNIEVCDDDIESMAIITEVIALRESGELEKAKYKLTMMINQAQRATPDLILLMSDLFYETGDIDTSKSYIKILYDYNPNYPGLKDRMNWYNL